mgnify:CR=1 FL=1
MIGLPKSDFKSDLMSAVKSLDLNPDIARIYPTLVIKGTELEFMYKKNLYNSLTLEEAVDRTVPIYSLLELKDINVIRVGLQPAEDLTADGVIISGPFHPAFRDLVENKIYFNFLSKIYEKEKKLDIEVNERNISKIVGQKARTKKTFYPNFKILINNNLDLDELKINSKKYTRKEILEGEFNEKFAASDPNRFKLFDKKNFQLKDYGHSKIEPADIITINKQFIHIKKGGSSANLSHLFAQGVVSAQLYKNEKKFIKEINETFGEGYFKSDDKIEVIYGIIDKRYDKKASEILPFFSMINLSQHYDVLSSMGIKCQLLFIEQKVPVYNKKEEQILNRVLETLGDHEKTSSELFESLNDFLMENKIGTKNTFKNKYLEKFVNNGNLQTNDARRNRKYRKQVTTWQIL